MANITSLHCTKIAGTKRYSSLPSATPTAGMENHRAIMFSAPSFTSVVIDIPRWNDCTTVLQPPQAMMPLLTGMSQLPTDRARRMTSSHAGAPKALPTKRFRQLMKAKADKSHQGHSDWQGATKPSFKEVHHVLIFSEKNHVSKSNANSSHCFRSFHA